MGLSEKVIIALVITVLTQIACRHCMPNISRRASSKRYLDNLKPVKNNPSPTSYTPSRVNKSTKQTFRKKNQNARINNNSVPQKSLYDTYNFPQNDYPLDNSPRDPFRFGNLNANQKVNTQKRGPPNPQCSAINDLKKEKKRKRKLLSNRQNNDENNLFKKETPLINMAISSGSTHLLDQGTFPEVQYPLTTMEAWEPKYWNYLPFTRDENQFHSIRRETFKPKVKDDIGKPFASLSQSKANKFIKSSDVLKGKQKQISTENSKRSSIALKGMNFTKTATCEKVADDFITAGLVSNSPKNVSSSKFTLERTAENINKSNGKYEVQHSSKSELNVNKKVDELENMCLPLELKNNTDDSNELLNIINQILKLESIEDETDTTVQSCNSSSETEKKLDTLGLANENLTSEETLCTPIDNTANCKGANFAPEELLTSFSNEEIADDVHNITLPLPAQTELENTINVEDPSNISVPLSFSANLTTNEAFINTSSTDPTGVTLLSNGNTVPGSTSIIIIPINNNVVGKSQSHVITGTPDTPIIVYIPSTQSSDSPTQNLPSEQYVSFSLDKIVQDNQLKNDFANMAPLQNISSDFVNEIINCNSHNGSSLPMYETLPRNSMCYNNESNPSSIGEKPFRNIRISQSETESAALVADGNGNIDKLPEDFNSEIISKTLPQTPDFEHPLLDFPGSELTLQSYRPYNENLSSESPIIAREIDLDQQKTNGFSADSCIEKHNLTSQFLFINDDDHDIEITVDRELVTPLSQTYLDDAAVESNKYVPLPSHADDKENIKNFTSFPVTEQYSLPVAKHELTSTLLEKPITIVPQHSVDTQLTTLIKPSTVELSKPTVSVSPSSSDPNSVNLPQIFAAELPLMQVSHKTSNVAQQPLKTLALLPITSNNLPQTTDMTLQSALLPEFYKVSLLLTKMLSHLETFTNNSNILSSISESDRPPLTTSQDSTDNVPLQVNNTLQLLFTTETPIEGLELRTDQPVSCNPFMASHEEPSEDSLSLSIEQHDSNSLLPPTVIPPLPTYKKMVAISNSNSVPSPIKDPAPISRTPSDNMSLPISVIESPFKSLQQMNESLLSIPISDSSKDSFPVPIDISLFPNSLVKPSHSPPQPLHETLSPKIDSNSFQIQIKSAQISEPPITETPIVGIHLLTDQPHPSNPVITSSKNSPPLPIEELLHPNSLSIPCENLPKDMNNIIQPNLDSDCPILQVTYPQFNSQISSENLCLIVNKTFEPFLATEKSIESSELKTDKSCPFNTLIKPTHSLPNNVLHPTADLNNVPPPSKETELMFHNTTDALCLPLNNTFESHIRTEAALPNLQPQTDKSFPLTPIRRESMNGPYQTKHGNPLSNSFSETSDSITSEETLLLTPISESTTDYRPFNVDNIVAPLLQSNTGKDTSTKGLDLYGYTSDDLNSTLKMDLLVPDFFEVSNYDLPLTVYTKPTVNSLTKTEHITSELSNSVYTPLSEIPVCDQPNPTDELKDSLDVVASDGLKYNLSENNLISDWSDTITQKPFSNDDLPLIANDIVIEIPNSDDTKKVLRQKEHFVSSEDNISPEFPEYYIDLPSTISASLNEDRQAAYPKIGSTEAPLLSDVVLDSFIPLSNESLEDLPSTRNKSYPFPKIIITKALLESLLEQREFSFPITEVLPVRSAKLIDHTTHSVKPSLSGMTQGRFPQESSSQEDKMQSNLDLSTNLTDELSDSEILLTLPVDNTLSKIPNVPISDEIITSIDEMHEDKSDILIDELSHNEKDIPPSSDNLTAQLPITADKDNKISNTLIKTRSSSKLLLTKAILDNVLSDMSKKENSMPLVKAVRVTSPSMLDKTIYNLDPTDSDVTGDTSQTCTDKILINRCASNPHIDNFIQISSFNNSQTLQSPIETVDQDNYNKTHNIEDLSLSISTKNFAMNDMLDKSRAASQLPVSKALLQNVLPDNEMSGLSLPIDKVLSTSSTANKTLVFDMIENSPSQLLLYKDPPYVVLSECPTDTTISEKPEDMSLSEPDVKLKDKISDTQISEDKQNVEKIGPSFSKLLITKELLESVLSDFNAGELPLPIASIPGLDKMHYEISPVLNTVANNPSQFSVDTKSSEKEQNRPLDSRMANDIKYSDDKNIFENATKDRSLSNGGTPSLSDGLGKISNSITKLPITKTLFENVRSEPIPKDLPKKSVLDKTFYYLEAPPPDLREPPLSPANEGYHNYHKPDSETYYVLTLPSDNPIFDIATVESPIDKSEILTDKDKSENEHLHSDNLAYVESNQMDEKSSLKHDAVHELPRTKPYLASKIFLTKSLLEKVLSDITISANAAPVITIT